MKKWIKKYQKNTNLTIYWENPVFFKKVVKNWPIFPCSPTQNQKVAKKDDICGKTPRLLLKALKIG